MFSEKELGTILKYISNFCQFLLFYWSFIKYINRNGATLLTDKCHPLGIYTSKSPPRAKIRMQRHRSGGKFSVHIPRGALAGRGWLWQKLIAALLKGVMRVYSNAC